MRKCKCDCHKSMTKEKWEREWKLLLGDKAKSDSRVNLYERIIPLLLDKIDKLENEKMSKM